MPLRSNHGKYLLTLGFRASGSEGISPEILDVGSHHPPTLCKKAISTVFVTAFDSIYAPSIAQEKALVKGFFEKILLFFTNLRNIVRRGLIYEIIEPVGVQKVRV